MSYFPTFNIGFADTPALDAFGRLRTSTPTTLFDSKQLADDRPLFWSTKVVTGATTDWRRNRASTTLSSSAAIGSTAIRQSKVRAPYLPGKSLSVAMSHVFGPSVAGVKKEAGLFDNEDGIFFQDNGGNFNLVLRSFVSGQAVDQVMSQSAWNLDKFDGTGASGITLDKTKAQISVIDFQWLGAGRVRAGFDVNGKLYYCHEFLNANVSSSVYISNPTLPIRYRIENVSAVAASTLEQICCTVQSEAGYDPKALVFTADRGTQVLSGATTDVTLPLVTIRLKSNYTGSYVVPKTAHIVCTTTVDLGFRWSLVLNPVFGPVDNAVWRDAMSSSIEYDVDRNYTNALTGGVVIASGYGSDSSNTVEIDSIVDALPFGSSIDGVCDELTFAVQVLQTQTTESYVASMTWKEYA